MKKFNLENKRVKRIKRNSRCAFLTKITLDTKSIFTSLSEAEFSFENRKEVVRAMNTSSCHSEFILGF